MSFLCTLALLSCLASASARLLLQTSSSGSNSNSFSSSNSSISDSSTSLPSDWTFGHATYYGGAPDGLVSVLHDYDSAWSLLDYYMQEFIRTKRMHEECNDALAVFAASLNKY